MTSTKRLKTLRKKFLVCLMMSALILSTSISKAENLDLAYHYTLDKDQTDKVIDCFEERDMLRTELLKSGGADHSEAVLVGVLAFLLGIGVGALSGR
jgi:hypothetical protein